MPATNENKEEVPGLFSPHDLGSVRVSLCHELSQKSHNFSNKPPKEEKAGSSTGNNFEID